MDTANAIIPVNYTRNALVIEIIEIDGKMQSYVSIECQQDRSDIAIVLQRLGQDLIRQLPSLDNYT